MLNLAIADISLVPLRDRGKVMTPSTAALRVAIFLAQYLCALAAGVAVPIGFAVLIFYGPLQGMKPAAAILAINGSVVAGGVATYLLYRLFDSKPWASLFLFNKTKQTLAQRSDAIVDVQNPDAIFVEIGLRGTPEDVGFAFIDYERELLLFEGDNKRYRIPARAMVSCEVKKPTFDVATFIEGRLAGLVRYRREFGLPLGVLLLTCRGEFGNREIPFRPLFKSSGEVLGFHRVARASHWEERLWPIMPEMAYDN